MPVRMSFNLIPPWTIPKQFKGQGSPQSGFGWALVPSTCREVRLAYFILLRCAPSEVGNQDQMIVEMGSGVKSIPSPVDVDRHPQPHRARARSGPLGQGQSQSQSPSLKTCDTLSSPLTRSWRPPEKIMARLKLDSAAATP